MESLLLDQGANHSKQTRAKSLFGCDPGCGSLHPRAIQDRAQSRAVCLQGAAGSERQEGNLPKLLVDKTGEQLAPLPRAPEKQPILCP